MNCFKANGIICEICSYGYIKYNNKCVDCVSEKTCPYSCNSVYYEEPEPNNLSNKIIKCKN